jgi:glyoxylase-like metal-dependent hydrolase (beta-lactamase superfamily II)
MIPYVRRFDFAYGRRDMAAPLIERVVADNPGPFTFTGTGVYVVGRAEPGAKIAVIDPGPLDSEHLHALLTAVEGRIVSHVLVTHTHRDHVPLARPFAKATGAMILAARPPSRETHASGVQDEDDDHEFQPDIILEDGEIITGDGWSLEAVFTPGHASNPVAFALLEENALFSGDHVMGWSTTVIAPPDGDMAAYMASLDRLMARDDAIYFPAHGDPVERPQRFVRGLMGHRKQREGQIVRLLGESDRVIPEMVAAMYAGIDSRLHGAAGRSVLAHLIDLERQGRVAREGETWRLAA